MMTDTPNTFWTQFYSPEGYKSSVTLALNPSADIGAQIAGYLASLKAAGLTPREQGTEPGESVETLTAMVRRSKGNDDGTTTPVIDLYCGDFKFRTLSIYINSDEDANAFRDATGARVAELPEFDATAPLERDNSARWTKYAMIPRKPARFVHEPNPLYVEGEKKPKRKFVRWMQDTAVPTPAPVASSVSQSNGASTNGSKSEAILNELTDKRSDAIKDAVAKRETVLSNIRQIKVGIAANNAKFIEFAAITEDGSGLTARYFGKTGSRLAGLQEAIGDLVYSQLKTEGVYDLSLPVNVTAERDANGYLQAKRVDVVQVEDF